MARSWKKTEAAMDKKQREKPGEDRPVKTAARKSSDERARGRYGEGK